MTERITVYTIACNLKEDVERGSNLTANILLLLAKYFLRGDSEYKSYAWTILHGVNKSYGGL